MLVYQRVTSAFFVRDVFLSENMICVICVLGVSSSPYWVRM